MVSQRKGNAKLGAYSPAFGKALIHGAILTVGNERITEPPTMTELTLWQRCLFQQNADTFIRPWYHAL